MSAFKDKVVLVTGGSRGIGRSIAVAFARQGATVVISYAGNEAAAQETLGLIQAAGAKGESVRFDVADSAACASALEGVVKTHGRLDVLVNNAGVAVDGLVMRVKDEDWDKQLDTNLKGAFALIRAASRPMMKQRGGAIINLTSVV
ncbi:MAG TPA: SDR family NAD(P)-dependent oxidoreductase, partial [Archangium sp.]